MSTRSPAKWRVLFGAFVCMVMVISLFAGCGGGDREDGEDDATSGGRDLAPVSSLAWPTPYQNDRRTGRSEAAGPQDPDVLWTYEGGSRTFSWAVLSEAGEVVVGFEGRVVALKPGDGTVAWEFATGGEAARSCDVGEDGTIYAGAGSRVYAIEPGGREKWSYDVGTTVDGPSVGPDGTIYAGSIGGKLVALSDSGELNWEKSVPGSICSPSFDEEGNLYCSAATLRMYALTSSGEQLWEFKPEGDLPVYEGLFEWANTLDNPSIGDDGTIYAGSYNAPNMTTTGTQIPGYAVPQQAKLYAISPGGEKLWEFVSTYECGNTVHSPSIAADGTLYCGTSCWRVLAVDPADGTLRWEFNTGEGHDVCPSIWSPSIGKDGLLYAATTSAKIFCITPEGAEKWRYQGPEPWLPDYGGSNGFTPPPIDGDGVMFSVLNEGKVFAFRSGAAPQ